MKLEWIAAALNPSDIAPHPNFMSAEVVVPSSLLALLSEIRWFDYERILQPDSAGASRRHYPRLRPGSSSSEMDVVQAIHESLTAGRVDTGAHRLATLARESDVDGACRTAASLFASVALCELDDYSAAIDLLQFVLRLDELSQLNRPDTRLLRAIALQQLALRQLESGRDGSNAAQEALHLMRSIRPSELSTFSTSKGVRWGSRHTLRQIIDELTWVSDAHATNIEGGLGASDWQRFVRAPSARLSLRTNQHAEGGFRRFVKESFDAYTGSNARTIHVADPIEPGVYATLLHYELIGANPQARSRRSDLGRLRVVRGGSSDRSWAMRDAIRLFRHADDRQSLDLALRHVRAAGPLEALRADAEQIVRNRVGSAPLRRVEMAVLTAAAHVLEEGDALAALEAVLAAVNEGSVASQRWEALSVQLEDAWAAAAQLSAPARQIDRVALELLSAVRAAESEDELLVRGLTRAARGLEWEATSPDTRQQWLALLESVDGSKARTLIDAVGLELGLVSDGLERPPLERLAAVLNKFFRTGVRPTADEIGDAFGIVTAELHGVQERAASGQYSIGALAAADVAAGLLAGLGMYDLWPPLVSFLLDERVARSDKAPALERLAREDAHELPSAEEEALRSGIQALLSTSAHDPFASNEDPFAPALRFATAYKLLSLAEILSGVARLGGSYGRSGRVEAARTLAIVGRAFGVPLWTQALALQLSHDTDAVVRGEAGRALAAMASVLDESPDTLWMRTAELLDEDGLLVPVLVLRGLREAQSPDALPASLLAQVNTLRHQHPARGIRIEAAALLDTLDE